MILGWLIFRDKYDTQPTCVFIEPQMYLDPQAIVVPIVLNTIQPNVLPSFLLSGHVANQFHQRNAGAQ